MENKHESRLSKDEKLEYIQAIRNAISSLGAPDRVCRSENWTEQGKWTDEMERQFQERLRAAGVLNKYG